MRIDASDKAMILTVEDRRRPALKLTRGSFMYDHFDLQMRYAWEQCVKIDIAGFPRRQTFAQVTENDIKDFMDKIGMDSLCSSLGADKILADCRANTNPYES